ncbi:hypothetical protein ACL7TT_19405 [Microbulbifer sp. 2304DJ12-6]|uniref:hypothetical protein n=1 Tax=Microbulbifer sp. 2304DJ12-6 TaxID=3233340 RepID=UPI0039B1078B
MNIADAAKEWTGDLCPLLDEEVEAVGYRPNEPANSGESPEEWAEIAEWEDSRAEFWKGKFIELQAKTVRGSGGDK